MYTSLRKGNNIYDEGPELLLIDGEGEASKEVRSRLQEVDTLHTCSSLFYLIALVLARSCLIKVQVSISCTSCSEKKDQKKISNVTILWTWSEIDRWETEDLWSKGDLDHT